MKEGEGIMAHKFKIFLIEAKGLKGMYKFALQSLDGRHSKGLNLSDILGPRMTFEREFESAKDAVLFYSEIVFTHFADDIVRDDWIQTDEESILSFLKLHNFRLLPISIPPKEFFADLF